MNQETPMTTTNWFGCCSGTTTNTVRRLLPVGVAVAVIFLLTGGYYTQHVYEYQRLSVGQWVFAPKDGRMWLVKGRWGLEETRHKWEPSCPTIRIRNGEYLAHDLTGRQEQLLLTKDKGPHAEWVFEIVRRITSREGGGRHREGDEGYVVYLSASNGPFKGWYVGEGPYSEEDAVRSRKEPVWQPLILVKDSKDAARIHFHDKHCHLEDREKR